MKKIFGIAACASLAACSSSIPPSGNESPSAPPTAVASATPTAQTAPASQAEFTNLGDEASLGKVTTALVAAGLPQADVDSLPSRFVPLTRPSETASSSLLRCR
ncbi:hypothetical protein [Trueperella pecoris]|uniref:Uncharacterized protein n=1 Tax=Trueperella pecoris TaxID=2733571 RepID=A0A7M1QTW2_9ACTO|nr:hypothetical protein [Trueperella pecoris]QOR44964.1 hypothetical protein INS88_06625 [Trueperella pecoris]